MVGHLYVRGGYSLVASHLASTYHKEAWEV